MDSENIDLVHHLDFLECDPSAIFDDRNLPKGSCDEFYGQIDLCASNFATAWAVGADFVSSFRGSTRIEIDEQLDH